MPTEDIMKRYFSGDCYRTPPDAPIAPLHRLLGGWRWAFYLRYAPIVLAARKVAVRGAFDDEAWAEISLRVLQRIERHGGRFEIAGLDRLRAARGQGPFVFIANHMSTLETQILPVLIVPFMPVTFVVKESLVHGPIFGPIMRSRDPVTVTRKNPRVDLESVLRGGAERLERGLSIIIFPQSTRRPEFKRDQFNTLGIKLALSAGVPVLPIALKTDFWGDRGLFKGFGPVRPERTIHFEFGRPLRVTGRGKEQHQEILEFIESRLACWTAEDGAR